MKLECPSCHQKYRLTNQTIPANKASVSCRVCTKPIPLKTVSARSEVPARSTQSVSCGYCGEKVGVNAVQATVSQEIPCPSCKHPIQMPSQQASRPVAAKPAFKGVNLTCSQCQQTYTLNRAKIPANAASATCKACGNKIPIPGSLAKHHTPQHQIEPDHAAGASNTQAVDAEVDNTPVSFGTDSTNKKTWYRAFTALMLAALIGFGIWFGGGWLLDMFKTGWEVLIESKPRPTMKTPSGTFSSKPLMTMRLNGPLVMHAVKGRIAQNSVHHKSLALLNTVGLESVEVFMLPQSEMLAVPAMYIEGKEIHHLQKLVAGYNLFDKSMHKAGAGQYVFDPAAIGKKYGKDYPEIPYTLWFHKNAILIAPEVLMKDPSVTLSRLKASRVSGFAGDLTSRRQAGTIAVKIPKTLENDWPVMLRQNPALQVDPRLAAATGMGASILLQLGDAINVIDMMGANLTVTGENRERHFQYRQRFRSRSAASAFKLQLETGDLKQKSTQWLIREMLRLFQYRRIEYTFTQEGRDLAVKVKWLPGDDQLIMNALIRAMFGEVVEPKHANTPNMAPSAETVKTITTVMPQYSLTANADLLKSQIGEAIQERLFPGQYWEGKEPRMTVDLDTIQFTNNTLTQMTYEVLSVKSRDGKDRMRRSDNQVVEHTLKPADPSPGFVAIGVKPGTAPESLDSAIIRFHLKVPTRLHEVEFSTIDPTGKTSVAGKIPVKLNRMEKDIAEISFKENPGVFTFAYDRNGNALALSESAQTGNKITRRYHGIIWRLKVLVVEKQLDLPLDLTVDLNGGQAHQLAHKPEIPPRYRFDHSVVQNYKELDAAALNNLDVKWHEGSETEWFDSLSIALPDGPIHGRADWEVNFFGHNKPVYLSGKRSDTSRRIAYTFDKGALRKVNAASGRVAMKVSTQIERKKYVKSTDQTPVIQKFASGKIVTVIFDQNEVTLTPFDDATVQIVAYDAKNRRLRRDAFSQNKGKMRKFYYWGVPTSVEVDIAASHIKKSIDFDIIKRPVDQEAYEAYKQQLAVQQEVVVTLKQISAARLVDRNHYGDDVAGLYYLYNRKQKTPMHLIEKAVAHSDTAGEKRFGYSVQPYKGYYFTVLAGMETNGNRKAFPLSKRKLSVSWEKGTIKAANYHQLPAVAAIPVDKSQPTFFVQSSRVFMKRLNGEDFQYLPEDPFGQEWVEARAVE